MKRTEFEVLQCLARFPGRHSEMDLSRRLGLSLKAVRQALALFGERGWVTPALAVTEEGLAALAPYRVRRALIIAAGFGQRMLPATSDRPKPMVTVRGKRILETLLDALLAAGVEDITIVRGYRGQSMDALRDKYPTVRFVDNTQYQTCNNISSVVAALDLLDRPLYITEADLLISNPEVIAPYQYASNILGAYTTETDDWCYDVLDGVIRNYRKGGVGCFGYYGISFWTKEDALKLKEDYARAFQTEEGRGLFFEFVPLVTQKERYRVEMRPCQKSDILEIDSFEELCQMDESYRK